MELPCDKVPVVPTAISPSLSHLHLFAAAQSLATSATIANAVLPAPALQESFPLYSNSKEIFPSFTGTLYAFVSAKSDLG